MKKNIYSHFFFFLLFLFFFISCNKKPTPPFPEAKNWTKINLQGTDLDGYWLFAIDFPTSDEGWTTGWRFIFEGSKIVGVKGNIFHYKDGVWCKAQLPSSYAGQSISFPTSNNGWIGGSFLDDTTASNFPLSKRGFLLHYENGQWSEVNGPWSETLSDTILSVEYVGFLSSDDGWLIYNKRKDGYAISYFCRYRNGKWELGNRVDFGNKPYFLSINEGWVVGGNYGKGILHVYDGNNWKQTTILGPDGKERSFPNNGCSPEWKWGLYDIHLTSLNNGWAVGGLWCESNSVNVGLILHYYKDGYWYGESLPPFDKNYLLNKVYFVSSIKGWATGNWWKYSTSGYKKGAVVFCYQNGSWIEDNEVPDLMYSQIEDIHFTSPNEGWMVGGSECYTDFGICTNGLLLHYKQ